MKQILTILSLCLLISCSPVVAQNLPVFEEIIASPSCPVVKNPKVTQALQPYVTAQSAILVIANCRNSAMNMADFNARYRTYNKYYQANNEQIRYNGKFSEHGSVFSDKHNGVYDVLNGTIDKYNAMVASLSSNGWSMNATYSVSGANVSVSCRVSAPVATSCNLVVVLTDKYGNFKQCLNGYDGTPVVVSASGTVTISGTTTYKDFLVVCFCQSPFPFSLDSWGVSEREIFCANYAK